MNGHLERPFDSHAARSMTIAEYPSKSAASECLGEEGVYMREHGSMCPFGVFSSNLWYLFALTLDIFPLERSQSCLWHVERGILGVERTNGEFWVPGPQNSQNACKTMENRTRPQLALSHRLASKWIKMSTKLFFLKLPAVACSCVLQVRASRECALDA